MSQASLSAPLRPTVIYWMTAKTPCPSTWAATRHPFWIFFPGKTSPCSRPSSRTSISIISTACTPCRKNSVRPATARKATLPSKTRNQQKADSGGCPGFPNSGKSISLTGKIPSVLSILKFFPLPVIFKYTHCNHLSFIR